MERGILLYGATPELVALLEQMAARATS